MWRIRILKILYTMKCIRISLGKSVFFFFNCGSDSYCFICQCSWKNAWVLFTTCEQQFLFIEVCRKQHSGIWSRRFISSGTWSQEIDRVNFEYLLSCELLNPDSLRSVWLSVALCFAKYVGFPTYFPCMMFPWIQCFCVCVWCNGLVWKKNVRVKSRDSLWNRIVEVIRINFPCNFFIMKLLKQCQ